MNLIWEYMVLKSSMILEKYVTTLLKQEIQQVEK